LTFSPQKKIYCVNLFFSCVVLVLGIWCASGTLAPYAATLAKPKVLAPCGYLANIDQWHFEAPFKFLDGQDRVHWEASVVLRRILYPLVAYPAMKVFGFMKGGLFTNLFIHLLVFLVFVQFVKKHVGARGAVAAMWLLSMYPGISYWAGLPYSYACIVPCSLLSFMCLWKVWEKSDPRTVALFSFGIGFLSIGYDLLPYFGPALMLVLLHRRAWKMLPLAAVVVVLPLLVSAWILQSVYGLGFINPNSKAYLTIVSAYLSFPSWETWGPLIRQVPSLFLHNFAASNFYVLPVLFVVLFVVSRAALGVRFHPVELSVLLSVLFVFLFNNLAPPYEGWQLRGMWIARLYQPVFVVYLFFIARMFEVSHGRDRKKWFFTGLIGISCVLQGLIVFGPVAGLTISDSVYHEFYRHEFSESRMSDTLEKYGRRPRGFCSTRH